MAEHWLIDANALCDELKNELNRHDPDLLGSRVITLFMEMISEYPTIDPETLPIVQELKEKLEHVTAERDAAIADLKRIAICKFCANGCAKKGRACFTCDNRECTCKSCFGRRKWEWRGLVAENTTTESEAKAND
mgnify:CR=1 FL=1